MSIMTSWKAAVSSACRWVCRAIFSLNFLGFEAPEPAPGPGPQPPAPVPAVDIFYLSELIWLGGRKADGEGQEGSGEGGGAFWTAALVEMWDV